MLVRYYSYITGKYGNIDLLYRFEPQDSYNSISENLDITINDLFLSNGIALLINEFVKNPKIENIKEFDKHVPINLYIEKTLWSK